MPFEISSENWNIFLNLAPLIGSLIVASILGATFVINTHNIRNQTKMNLAEFYHNFDEKLRKTEHELLIVNKKEHDKIYHNMMKIIITLTHIIDFKENIKINFDILYFEQWFRFGFALPAHLKKHSKIIGEGDQKSIDKLKEWCNKNKINEKNPQSLPSNVTCAENQV